MSYKTDWDFDGKIEKEEELRKGLNVLLGKEDGTIEEAMNDLSMNGYLEDGVLRNNGNEWFMRNNPVSAEEVICTFMMHVREGSWFEIHGDAGTARYVRRRGKIIKKKIAWVEKKEVG